MKIDSNSEGKITVALSNEDMNELDITYDELDYSNIETRRVIWTLLDKAGQQLGKCIDTDVCQSLRKLQFRQFLIVIECKFSDGFQRCGKAH